MDDLADKLKQVFSFGRPKKFSGSGKRLGTSADSPHVRVNRGQQRAPDAARAAELSQKLAAVKQHQPLQSQQADGGFDPFKASTVTGNAFTSAVQKQEPPRSAPTAPAAPAQDPPAGPSSRLPRASLSALTTAPPTASPTPGITGYEVDDSDIDAMQHHLALVASAPSSFQSLTTLQKILSNIVKAPSEAKFRQVRMINPRIQEAIVGVGGALEFLAACGFEVTFVKQADGAEEGVVIFPEDGNLPHLQEGIQLIQLMQQGLLAPPPTASNFASTNATPDSSSPSPTAPSTAITSSSSSTPLFAASATTPAGSSSPAADSCCRQRSSATAGGIPIRMQTGAIAGGGQDLQVAAGAGALANVDRQTQVVLPVTPDTKLPEWFFDRTPADLKREYAAAMKKREQSSILTTRAHKEKLASANAGPHPTHALIRIRFPEGVHLQGCFAAEEPVNSVHSWLESCLSNVGVIEYELVDHNRKPLPLTGTIRSADLLPTAMLSLRFTGALYGQRGSVLSDAVLRKAVVGEE